MQYDFPVYGEKMRRFMVDRRINAHCALARVIGQERAVELVADACYSGFERPDHFVEKSLIFVGGASTGKTHLATAMADTLDVVRVITEAQQIKNADNLAHLVLEAWARYMVPLEPAEEYGKTKLYRPDTTLIFIDEIHGLTDDAQTGLLKATERSDGMLFGKNRVIDLRKAIWIGATTNWGKLLPAFQTRFVRVQLFPYHAHEVAQIVHKKKRWEMRLCERIVFFGGLVPRETFQFAGLVEDAAKRRGQTMLEVVEEVAAREGIDKFGMRIQRLMILRALQGKEDGMLLRHLVGATGLDSDELLDYWLPAMLIAPPGEKPLVAYDKKYFITERGEEELRKR